MVKARCDKGFQQRCDCGRYELVVNAQRGPRVSRLLPFHRLVVPMSRQRWVGMTGLAHHCAAGKGGVDFAQ
jgi:hypothetical protein